MNYELWSFVGALALVVVLSPLLIKVVRRNAKQPDEWLRKSEDYLRRVQHEEKGIDATVARVSGLSRLASEKVAAAVSPFTPVCPECGLVDEDRPFVRHALGCLRTPCGEGKSPDAVRRLSRKIAAERVPLSPGFSRVGDVIVPTPVALKIAADQDDVCMEKAAVEHALSTRLPVIKWNDPYRKEIVAEAKLRGIGLGIDYTGIPKSSLRERLPVREGFHGGACSGELGFDG